jgi:hypothetical protein
MLRWCLRYARKEIVWRVLPRLWKERLGFE